MMRELDPAIVGVRRCGDSMARLLDSRQLTAADFATAAEEILIETGGIAEIGLESLAVFLAQHDSPDQTDWRFSDLPVIIYRHSHFYIELLHWVEATTSIHEHAFSGAFMVVSGSSLHARFRLTDRRDLAPHVQKCVAEFIGSEHLLRGHVRQIAPGPDGLIHSLYHLDSPSVSLVLRTYGHSADQFSLQRPRLWWNELRLTSDRRTSALLRTVRLAESIRRGDGRTLLHAVAKDVDDSQWVFLLIKCAEQFGGQSDFEDLLCARPGTSDDLNRELKASYEALLVEQQLTAARRSIRDPDLRFLLAILLNITDRSEIYRMVAMYARNNDPVTTVAGWLAHLAVYRGDPRDRLARLAASAAVDHRLGVTLRALLPNYSNSGDLSAAIERVMRTRDGHDVTTKNLREVLAALPMLRPLLP